MPKTGHKGGAEDPREKTEEIEEKRQENMLP